MISNVAGWGTFLQVMFADLFYNSFDASTWTPSLS